MKIKTFYYERPTSIKLFQKKSEVPLVPEATNSPSIYNNYPSAFP